jgi:hypothetical protein
MVTSRQLTTFIGAIPMKLNHRRRIAVAITTTALVGASIVAGAVSGPGQIQALPGAEESTVVNIEPTRVLDTRVPVGLTGQFQSQVPRKLMVTGDIETYVEATTTKTTKMVVPTGSTGVVMNVTAVLPTAAGYLAIRPGDAVGTPSTAGLNFAANDVIPNHITVAVPTTGPNAGMIDIAYFAATTGPTMDVVVDIVGYTTKAGLADLVGLVNTKANSADVYTKAEVDAALLALTPIARSARRGNVSGDFKTRSVALSVTIEAPVAGLIQINAGAWIDDATGGQYNCRLTIGAGETGGAGNIGDLEDTDRLLDLSADVDSLCQTSGAVSVSAGTHVINLVLKTPVASPNSYDDATLDALFIPGGTLTIVANNES